MRPVVVLLEAVALGEAGRVEPVPGPALAEVGRGEELVEERRVGLGRIESQPAPPRPAAAGRSGRSRPGGSSTRGSAGEFGVRPFSSSFASTKRSIGLRHQASFFTGRRLDGCQRLERPELAGLVGHDRRWSRNRDRAGSRPAACRREPRGRSSGRSRRSARRAACRPRRA